VRSLLVPAVHLDHLSFSYSSAVTVFDDVSVHLGEGWTGVVGPNGAGKSTLLGLIAGSIVQADGDLVLDPSGAIVTRCPQEVDAPTAEIEALTVSDDGEARRWMGRLDLDPIGVSRWTTLSPGERKRWQLAAALASDPDVLLLDEPTNHLDAAGRALVEAALNRFLGVGLVISHDRGFLDRLTQRTLRIERSGVHLWGGPYSTARAEWEAEERLQSERYHAARREEKALRRRLADERRSGEQRNAVHRRRMRTADGKDHDATSAAATGRHAGGSAAGQRRRTVMRADIDRVGARAASLAPDVALGSAIAFDFEPSPKRVLLQLSGPLVAGDVVLADRVDVMLGRDDRVRVIGPNGSGKSTLILRLLDGARIPSDRLLYLPQEMTRDDGARLLERVAALGRDRKGRVLSIVAALGVDPDDVIMSARPSPGEVRKLAIAYGLGAGVWALLLDEPTNHLDLPAVERIEAAIAAYPGALVLVTHDDTFGRDTTTTTWELGGGRLVDSRMNPGKPST
jgi:ATPase subunit of ABC transporter with duplicated ATPase domains